MRLRITRLPLKTLRRAMTPVNRAGELDRLPRQLALALPQELQSSMRLLDPVARQAVSFDCKQASA